MFEQETKVIAKGLTAAPIDAACLHLKSPSGEVRTEGSLKRDAVKTLTYGIMHFCVAISVAFVMTQDWRIALGIGLIEPVVQTFAYALHEKGWSNLKPKSHVDALEDTPLGI